MYDGLTCQIKVKPATPAELIAGVTSVVVIWLMSRLLAETVFLRQFCCQP